MRILVVEDNTKIAQNIKTILEHHSFSVDTAGDGEAGERMASAAPYDVIVLDILLPKKDGLTVCKNLRQKEVNTPILMLTALGELEDRVEGLDSGADDYMVKPFAMQELLARLRALLRRPAEKQSEILSAKDISIQPDKHVATKGGVKLSLTVKEYSVLEYLIRNKGQIVSRDTILEHCWDLASNTFSNIVDAHIKQLRKKLSTTHDEYIETIRGIGYRFKNE